MTDTEKGITEILTDVTDQAISPALSFTIVLLLNLASGIIPVGFLFGVFSLACAVECTALPWAMFLIAPVIAIASYIGMTMLTWKQADKLNHPNIRWLHWYLFASFF